jgi:hypothetical protein
VERRLLQTFSFVNSWGSCRGGPVSLRVRRVWGDLIWGRPALYVMRRAGPYLLAVFLFHLVPRGIVKCALSVVMIASFNRRYT